MGDWQIFHITFSSFHSFLLASFHFCSFVAVNEDEIGHSEYKSDITNGNIAIQIVLF